MRVVEFNHRLVQRSKGQSAVMSAAYRHGRNMKAEVTGQTFDYSVKDDVTHAEITLPEDAPAWLVEAYGDRALGRLLDGREALDAARMAAVGQISERLWNDVEAFEAAHNRHAPRARLARKLIIALPKELTEAEQIELGRAFVRNSLAARGAVVDWVRHDPGPNAAGEENPHLHVMVTLRDVGEDGWGLKNRVWETFRIFRGLRAEWAREANIALERAGRPERIDHRKLVEQGIELEPGSYDRTLALALEERGEDCRRKVKAEEALEANRAYLKADPEHILVVVSAERTVFTWDDVERAFQRQGFEKRAATVLTGQAMTSAQVVTVPGSADAALYVTQAQLDVQAGLMAEAQALAASTVGVGQDLGTEDLHRLRTGLDAGQRAALEEMISDRRLSLVSGYAGTGKTHVIAQAAEVWRARGYEVLGGAISGRATQGLEGIEGLRALSLAGWEARWSRGVRPEAGKFVFFLDEAGMVGTATWARVQAQVSGMGGKLIAVGDPEQLQPVLDTGVFGRLMNRFGGAVIDTVRRMRDAGDRQATRDFAQGADGALRALAHYRAQDGVKEHPTVGASIEALVAAYYAAPPVADGPDLIETGTGPILFDIAGFEEGESDEANGMDGTAAGGAAHGGGAHAGGAAQTNADRRGDRDGDSVADGAGRGGRGSEGKEGARHKGPSAAAVRDALEGRAEDLFRAVFGEPVHPGAAEWRAKANGAVSMEIRGPKRGLWHDHSAGAGGDLLDLIAREHCGYEQASQDFPAVLAAAASWCGMSVEDARPDTAALARLEARRTEREKQAALDAARAANRRAALVRDVEAQARPVAGSPAQVYLAGRGITDVPEAALGWLPPMPGVGVRSPEYGALLVRAQDQDGRITGGQRILVTADGTPAPLDVRKPSFGAIGGSFARFPAKDGADGPLIIAEGPESALSIWQVTGHETWAVFGASNWRNVPLPTDRPVILAPDRDAPDSPAGRAFRKAVAHHLARGSDLSIALAPEPEGSKADLNDTLQRAGAEAVRAAIAAARPIEVAVESAPSAGSQSAFRPQSRVAIGYSGQDVDALNDALRAEAIRLGHVDETAEVDYGEIARLDRRGLLPRRYTAPMLLAPGDRVIFTRPHRALGISRSSFATVTMTHPDRVVLELDDGGSGGRQVEIDMSEFDHFDYGYAATTHRLQGVTVDRAYALAHPRMSRPVSYVMMSRHRDSVEMFVPESRFRETSFEKSASRDDALEIEADPTRLDTPVTAGRTFAEMEVTRPDILRSDKPGTAAPVSGVSFLRDPHLLGEMRRMAGLLASDWAEGDPVLADDPGGYAEDATRVIDDLVARRAVFRARDVASALSRVARHPDSFVRLYRDAMAHPDLVMLAPAGPDRVYSTGDRVRRDLDTLDLGVALGLAHTDDGLSVPDAMVREAFLNAGLKDSTLPAALHAAGAGQLRLITGASGTGKTRALEAVGQAHEAGGFTVHRLAPTQNAARALEDCGDAPVRTIARFLRALETGEMRLDARSMIVLDEAGLTGMDEMRDLFEVMEVSGAKLVAVWDPGQVSGVSAGGLFDDLAARLGTAVLDVPHRQGSETARATIAALDPDISPRAAGLQVLDAGHLETAPGLTAAIAQLVDGYLADRSPEKLIVTATRAEAAEVNRAILLRRNPTGAPNPTGDVTAAELQEGDPVRLSAWYAPARLPGGTRGVVVQADAREVRLLLMGPGPAQPDRGHRPDRGQRPERRHVVIRRDDAEFRCGMGFARSVHEAKGQGHASVHVLARPTWDRAVFVTAAGLHSERFRVVLPAGDETRGREMLSDILSRRGRMESVAEHVLDPGLAGAAAAEAIASLRRHARGAGSPWSRVEEATAEISEADLIADPTRILSVLAARRARFSLADMHRAMATRVRDGDVSHLVAQAMASDEIVWLKETGVDGQPLFTTRANENAAYLLAHPAHILTLMAAERTVFTRDDLEGALADRLPQEDVAPLLDQVSRALVPLEAWGPQGHQLFTTRAQIATEQALVAEAREMAGQTRDDTQAPVDPLPAQITGAQRAAGEAMLDGRGLVLVRGVAGSGKTTVLREVAARWRARGFDVCGGALGGRAAEDLGAGVPEMSVANLAAWEARWARGWRPSGKGLVFIMDEAAMVDGQVWARVQTRVKALGGKLIAVGDPGQLQPISAGNAWLAVEGEVGSVVIDRVRRQAHAAHRSRTEMFATGRGAEAVRGYAQDGAIRFEDSVETAIEKVAQRYFTRDMGKETRIALAYTREDVAALNTAIRAEALKRGRVDERRGAVQVGDHAFAVGDRVRFAAPDREQGIARSSFGTVVGMTDARDPALEIVLAGGRRVLLAGEAREVLDHGYAATIHASQGMTVDHAMTLAHGFMDRHTLYVAMSRHVKSVDLVVPRTRIEGRAALEALAMRSSARPLAAQVAPERTPEPDGALGLQAGFEEDGYLTGVLTRITGLLRAAQQNSPEGEADSGASTDPRGYARAPHLVIDDIMVERATFGAEDVARRLMPVTRDADSFARLFREAMSRPDLLQLTEGDDGEGRIYTTRSQFDLELGVMDRAVALAFGPRAEALDQRFVAGIIKERGLSEDQADALRATASGQRLAFISGGSGAGKTYLAGALADLHHRQGHQVIAVSPTGRGVDNLRSEGVVRPMTLKGLEEGDHDLDARTVILLDEAVLVGAKTADRLLERVEATGAKLIAFTDTDQLDAHEAGPVFRTLEARLGGVELGHRPRQQDEVLARGVKALGDHQQADEGLRLLEDAGVFQARQSRGRSIERLAADYVRDTAPDKIVLAHSRRDVAEINSAVRAQLDLYYPERLAEADRTDPAPGSVADLRPGDRIRLTRWYGPPKSGVQLRAGTEAVVEKRIRQGGRIWWGGRTRRGDRSQEGVVLRIGTGSEAQHVEVRADDPDIQYDFAFASTIHSAKGRGTASVHMLASPGLTRRLLYTGAALSLQTLNIVVPTSKAQMTPALTAITRREDSDRAALDYGFDASARARDILRDRRAPDTPAPGALMDGLDRTLGWVADLLDGGVNKARTLPASTRRRSALRTAVVVELMAASENEARFDLPALEARIDRLITGTGWRRFLGEGWGLRAFEADTERVHVPGVARADQMTRRVLRRGMDMAGATGEDALRDWFARAEANVTASIEAQVTAQPGVRSAGQTTEMEPVTDMALQLAQAISERLPREHPVHHLDQVTELEAMLRDSGQEGAGRLARLPYVPWTDDAARRLAPAVAQVLAMGPLQDADALKSARVAVVKHLENPTAGSDPTGVPTEAARAFVPRLKVFTHNEIYALHEPEAAWPDSLPPRDRAARKTISARLQRYRVAFTEGRPTMEREDILQDLMRGQVTLEVLTALKAAFTEDEIPALRTPAAPLPKSLPALDMATRQKIAEALAKAGASTPRDSSGDVGQVPAPVPAIGSPERRALARGFVSAISQHLSRTDPLHDDKDLLERVMRLLDAPPGKAIDGREVEDQVMRLRRARLKVQVQREVMEKRGQHHWVDEVIYGWKNRAFLGANSVEREQAFDVEVARLCKTQTPPPATVHDRVFAELICRKTRDADLLNGIGKALRIGAAPPEAGIEAARAQVLSTLVQGHGFGEAPDAHVKALFAVFSKTEVEALLTGESLPGLPALEGPARARVTQGLAAMFASVEAAGRAPPIRFAQNLIKTHAPKLGLDKGPDIELGL